eukprot:maker-scaffold_13-snap-gene-10.3-mRNA-1 protein AED:0.32 eAED:0.32 QI:96/1/1/1/1/1/4/96/331
MDKENAEYETIKKVAEGMFAKVYLGKNKKTHETFILKRLKHFFDRRNKKKIDEIAENEVSILKALDHENVIHFFCVWKDQEKLYLVFEVANFDLHDVINSKQEIEDNPCIEITSQILKALEFIHGQDCVHRDIKPNNILFKKTIDSYVIKLCDFGSSRTISNETTLSSLTGQFGNRFYKPPEVLLGLKYNSKVDIWALGIVLIQMLTNNAEPFWYCDADLSQLCAIFDALGVPCEKSWPEYSSQKTFIQFNPSEDEDLKFPRFLENLQFVEKKGIRKEFGKQALNCCLKINPGFRSSATKLREDCKDFFKEGLIIKLTKEVKKKEYSDYLS